MARVLFAHAHKTRTHLTHRLLPWGAVRVEAMSSDIF